MAKLIYLKPGEPSRKSVIVKQWKHKDYLILSVIFNITQLFIIIIFLLNLYFSH